MHPAVSPPPSLPTARFGAEERSKNTTKSPKCWGNSSPAFRWPSRWDPLSLLCTPRHKCSHLLALLISALGKHEDLTFYKTFLQLSSLKSVSGGTHNGWETTPGEGERQGAASGGVNPCHEVS